MIWPVRLSSHYPIPSPLSLADRAILAGVIGTCILIPLLIFSLRWTRALLVGWLFFFVALLPTTGIIGFNNVVAADKYAYLPSVGLLLILAWVLNHCWTPGNAPQTRKGRSAMVLAVVALVAGVEIFQTRDYLRYWQDTRLLRQHMLDLAPDAATPHASMGNYLVEQRQWDEAIGHFNTALHIEPNNAHTHYNLANALVQKDRREEAIKHYNIALQLMPRLSQAHNNLAMVLAQTGRYAEAVPHYREAIAIRPESVAAHYNLGLALAELGQADDAIDAFRATLRLQPRSADSYCNIGILLGRQGRVAEASEAYSQALQIDPNHQRTLAALAALRYAATLPAK
jgi:Flp pilus assembly protein TadD